MAPRPGGDALSVAGLLLAWWRFFGTPDPFVLTARDRRRARRDFAAPIFLREPGRRKLLPIGVGLSDYIDALGDPGRHCVAGDLFMAAIAEAPGWDECWLPDLAPDGLLAQAARRPRA